MSSPSSNLHFVLRQVSRDRWHDVLTGPAPKVAEVRNRLVSTEDASVVLTYLHYRHHGYDVTIDCGPREDKINVIAGALTRRRDFSPDCFYVACRNDGPFPAMGHVVLHLNLLSTGKRNEIYVPHWTQPGLVGRDPKRGNSIKTVAFFGHPERNLLQELRSDAFMAELEKRGIEFLIKGKNPDWVEWHDFSNADVILAIRDDTVPEAVLRLKPVTKVANAWLAGALCITGKEPAVEAAFPDSEVVLSASSADEVLAIIDRLRSDPELFGTLVRQGNLLAQRYTEEAVMGDWIKMEQQVTPMFAEWRKQSKLQKLTSYGYRAAAHYVTRLIWKAGRY